MKTTRTELILSILEDFITFLLLIAIHYIIGAAIAKGMIWLFK